MLTSVNFFYGEYIIFTAAGDRGVLHHPRH